MDTLPGYFMRAHLIMECSDCFLPPGHGAIQEEVREHTGTRPHIPNPHVPLHTPYPNIGCGAAAIRWIGVGPVDQRDARIDNHDISGCCTWKQQPNFRCKSTLSVIWCMRKGGTLRLERFVLSSILMRHKSQATLPVCV